MTEKTSGYLENNPKKVLSAIVLLAIFLLLVLANFFLGVVSPEIGGSLADYGSRRHVILREHNPETSGFMVTDMSLTDSLEDKKYRIAMDDNGFIVPSKVHDESDVDIVFMGGSTTECLYVDELKRFPYLAGRMIEETTGEKINSFNSGVSGNNSLHSINIFINKILPSEPDVVVLMHNINDVTALILDRTYWSQRPSKGPIQPSYIKEDQSLLYGFYLALSRMLPNIIKELNKYTNLESLLLDDSNEIKMRAINLLGGNKLLVSRDEIITAFEKNLRLFIAACKIYKVQLVLMTQANRFLDKPDDVVARNIFKFGETYGIEYLDYKKIYDDVNQVIRNVSADEGVILIDLAEMVPQTSEYMYDPVHFNNYGSEFVSRIIAEHLVEKIDFLKAR